MHVRFNQRFLKYSPNRNDFLTRLIFCNELWKSTLIKRIYQAKNMMVFSLKETFDSYHISIKLSDIIGVNLPVCSIFPQKSGGYAKKRFAEQSGRTAALKAPQDAAFSMFCGAVHRFIILRGSIGSVFLVR